MLDREPIWLDSLSELVSDRWWKGFARGEINAETWLTLWERDPLAAELVIQESCDLVESGRFTMRPSLACSLGST